MTRVHHRVAVLAASCLLVGACASQGTGAQPNGMSTDSSTAPGTPAPGSTAPATTASATPTLGGSSALSLTAVPTPAETQASPLPAVGSWRAGPGEVLPEIKEAATGFVETAGTWSAAGEGAPGALGARLEAAGLPPALASAASPLVEESAAAATVEVVYPQYGGLTADVSSVIIHLRQHLLGTDGSASVRELVLDVRLSRSPSGTWAVTGVVLAPPLDPVQPVSPVAEAVLANENIVLPGPARQDILSGRIQDSVLSILAAAAQTHVLDVLVVYTGHPEHVFETDRVSDHTLGQAVDIWRIDGQPIVDPTTPPQLVADVMLTAGELGATSVGGPFDVNGDGRGYFTDAVHQDHIHIGVNPTRQPVEMPTGSPSLPPVP